MKFSSPIHTLRRITAGGNYLPEIDGLRFIAIAMVVCIMHLGNYVKTPVLGSAPGQQAWLERLILEGGYGVSIFFIISGFILSYPFARHHFSDGQPIHLKAYFVRRFSRIEPPYIVSLIIYFLFRVWVLHYDSFAHLLPHFIASAFYVHNFAYQSASAINGVAWSLEVETQFYILMPLLSLFFLIRNKSWRYFIFILLIIIGTVYSYATKFTTPNFVKNSGYFLTGMLLTDLYIHRSGELNNKWIPVGAAILFIGILVIPSYSYTLYYCGLKLMITALFMYWVLTNPVLKKIMSCTWITIIGGMCYSIYLIHMGVIGLLSKHFAATRLSENNLLNATWHYGIALLLVLGASTLFYVLVERPTMQKDWYKHIFRKQAKAITA